MRRAAVRGETVPGTGGRGLRGPALVLSFVLLLWAGCGETRTPAQPTVVARDAPRSTPSDARAGALVVTGTGATPGDDHYVLNAASVAGDTLTVSVSFAGGCETHAFTLVVAASFIKSSPVRLPAMLAHEANDDPCEAWLTQSITFDLSTIGTRYRQAYGPGAGRVVLQLDGVPDGHLVYEFTT